MTGRVVVPAAPLPPPFRAAARVSRLVADDQGLHWVSGKGRRTTWRRGPDGVATAWVLSGGRARSVADGRLAGPLLVVGDAAERPLLVIPVAEWCPVPPRRGWGDPLRGTALRPLVDVLGLRHLPVGDDDVLALPTSRLPVLRPAPPWTHLHTVGAAAGGVATAAGTVLGITRGNSMTWAAVALVGLVVLLVAGAAPMVSGLVRERRTMGGLVEVARPWGGHRKLLLARREHGLEIGVREDDGVECWLPIGRHTGAVAQVRTTPATVELMDHEGAAVLALGSARWLPDRPAQEALQRLCTAAGLPLRAADGRRGVPPPPCSDLPLADATWPRLLPRPALLTVVGGVLGGINGGLLLLGAEALERHLGLAFLAVSAGSLLLWLRLRWS